MITIATAEIIQRAERIGTVTNARTHARIWQSFNKILYKEVILLLLSCVQLVVENMVQ